MKDKVILITGGAGSFGQALTEALLKCEPKAIRIFDNNEFAQVDMQRRFTDSRLRFLVGDVRDEERVSRALNGVDIVIHAAALKHIPICEYNPFEAVKTNVLGSMNAVDASINNGVDKVLAISSDKAVHPINLYGATKLTMEKLFIQANVYGKTKFSCLRSGNFEESQGSFAPLIREQWEAGKTITLTDREMSRFWISTERVAQFAIDCIDMMEGGEIFIPRMSRKYILELIKRIAPNAPYQITGKRPGEKLTEMLFAEGEKPEEYDDYFVIRR